MSARPPEVCDAAGNIIPLGAEVGQGGEGIVFDVRSSTDIVAKIYHQPLSTERANKIRLMASLRSEEISRLTAWPTNLLSTKQGQRPIGLLMPKVFGTKDIHRLYSVKSRRTDFQRVDWRFLIRAASNTARAFGAVHQMNCVIGDVNHGSILVGQDATVKLIDCDSFQIISGNQRYLCGVGVDTFTPPELQGHTFAGVVRTPNHDNFGLAVMIFLLLFMGKHPFAGLYTGGDMPIAKAIGEYRFAYGSKSKQFSMSRPPGAASLAIVGPEVSQLFERAFSREGAGGGRPTAREWADALGRLEADLRQCTANSSHWFHKGDGCPWCPIEGSTGIALFSLVVQTAAGATFEIEALWRQANAIPNPGPAPALGISAVVPSAEALSVHQARRNSKLVAAAIGLALTGIGIFGGLDSPAPFWLVVTGIAAYFIISKAMNKTEKIAEYKRTLDNATKAWASAKQEWENRAGPDNFNRVRAMLAATRQQWDGLATVRLKRLDQVRKDQHKLQLERYLDSFEIERAQIEGFGSGRKQLLRSYNIETAADVWRASNVPGVGPVLLSRLVNWRTSLESRFRFDPNKGVDPRDIAQVEQEILSERKKLEQQLRAGIAELHQVNSQIQNARNHMRAKIDAIHAAYRQASADSFGRAP